MPAFTVIPGAVLTPELRGGTPSHTPPILSTPLCLTWRRPCERVAVAGSVCDQGLTISELHCCEAEMQALEARFGNDTGVDYLAFLDIVEPSPAPPWKFVDRLKELRITNDKPPLPELYPADSLEALLQKIKTKVKVEEGKGRTLVIAPLSCLPATAEALRYIARTEQRRTYLPLYLPDRSRYSFTDPERMEG